VFATSYELKSPNIASDRHSKTKKKVSLDL
jgi:hypothetical protein